MAKVRIELENKMCFKEVKNKSNIKQIVYNNKLLPYYISDKGRVYSSVRFNKENKFKELKQETINSGYKRIGIFINGKQIRFSVHRLVANAFIDNPDNKPYVNHKDGNKINNNKENLEWSTESENTYHAFNTGLMKKLYGEDMWTSHITEKQAIQICELLEENVHTRDEIAWITDTSYPIVCDIINRRSWTVISENFDIDSYCVRKLQRLNKNTVEKICILLQDTGLSIAEISKQTRATYCHIEYILKGITWKNISYKYDFSSRI